MPFSSTRRDWLLQRAQVLDKMIVELSTRQPRYQYNQHVGQLHSTVMQEIRTEHLKVVIELNVLAQTHYADVPA